MSCCEGTSGGLGRYSGTGCCGTSCAAGKTGCSASEPRIRSCLCQENVGCLDRADCGGFRPRGTAATGACPGPCQCAEEEAWNRIVPPKPNCEWLTNFSELRRQWSDHGRMNNCKCCNCKPCRTAAPCKPCLTPPPTSTTTNSCRDGYQVPCNKRLSGGSPCEQNAQIRCSSSQLQDRIPAGGCPQDSCSRTIPPSCPTVSNSNMCSRNAPPSCSPSECSIRSPATCRTPSSCQPCSPSPRVAPKKRSCCQCINDYCMCQPMPRDCNCPPPVQVDARAERECSCDCPSSPECACPPSERRFARTKVKCPNARLCCATPRAQPGAKCDCTKCQPCLPPPCDPCTASKCRTPTPRVKPCCGDSSCDESAACRPSTPQPPPNCRSGPTCADCRKTPSLCRTPARPCPPSTTSTSRPGSAHLIRLLNRSRSPNSPRSTAPSTKYDSPGQSRNRVDLRHSNNDERENILLATNEGFGDDDKAADLERREAQCHCGPLGSRGCDEECDFCCSLDCDENRISDNAIVDPFSNRQCNCGNANGGCAHECDYCCSVGCDEVETPEHENNTQYRYHSNENACSESYDYCCSQNSDFEFIDFRTEVGDSNPRSHSERIGGGGSNYSDDAKNNNKPCVDGTNCDVEPLATVCDGVVPTVDREQQFTFAPRSSTSRCTVCGFDEKSSDPTFFSDFGGIGHSILVPGPLALVSFVLIIFFGLTWAFGLALYRRYNCAKKRMLMPRTSMNYGNFVRAAEGKLEPCYLERCYHRSNLCRTSQFGHQNHADCCQSAIYAALLDPSACACRLSILDLLEHSWQLGRLSNSPSFEDSVLSHENWKFRREFDVAAGNRIEIPSTSNAAVQSQSQLTIPEGLCSRECDAISGSRSADEHSFEISSESLEDFATFRQSGISRTKSQSFRVVCDDSRSIISNIDLRLE